MSRAWTCLRCRGEMRAEVCPRACWDCSHTLVRLKTARGPVGELARTLAAEQLRTGRELNQTDLRVRLRAWLRATPSEGDVQELGFLIKGAIRDAEWLAARRPPRAAGE